MLVSSLGNFQGTQTSTIYQNRGKSLIGNPVKIRDGPAAVTDDERRIQSLIAKAVGKTRQVG